VEIAGMKNYAKILQDNIL